MISHLAERDTKISIKHLWRDTLSTQDTLFLPKINEEKQPNNRRSNRSKKWTDRRTVQPIDPDPI